MAGKREKPEDIVLKLRQVEVLQGQGKLVQEAVRQIGVKVQTYYRWRKEYGGIATALKVNERGLEAHQGSTRHFGRTIMLQAQLVFCDHIWNRPK